MKKPRRFDNFFIGILNVPVTTTKISVQSVEIIIYDENSTQDLKSLKCTKRNQSGLYLYKLHFHWVFNDNIHHEGNISKMPDWNVGKVKLDLMV